MADIVVLGIFGPIVGHVGDGNFYAFLLLRRGDVVEVAIAKVLAVCMADCVLVFGGIVMGEHGIGMGKLGYMEVEYGFGWAVMGEIKRVLDLAGILNPGKLVLGN